MKNTRVYSIYVDAVRWLTQCSSRSRRNRNNNNTYNYNNYNYNWMDGWMYKMLETGLTRQVVMVSGVHRVSRETGRRPTRLSFIYLYSSPHPPSLPPSSVTVAPYHYTTYPPTPSLPSPSLPCTSDISPPPPPSSISLVYVPPHAAPPPPPPYFSLPS
ncbi:hypothetical protein Pcinc_032976 [Petrolisthes cinctipes]|uniref:Uncharacterized protein n=1 Tax=Petrolisthes cinctipes TaxID=88211 RepID=A0AAE1JYA8_PETCI|nr:hypothetical protein Pcinc_032976 [Petrolisthes cinctipes]